MRTMKTVLLGVFLATTTLFAGGPNFGALVFFDASFEDVDVNEFDLTRAYFTMSNKLSDNLSYKFQTDMGSGTVSAYSVYLKNAKLDWMTDFGKFTFGLQGMNMFKVQEANWGYRFIEKSAMDLNRYSSSADLGIAWARHFGGLSAKAMITNGRGYKKAENDGYKKTSLLLHAGPARLKDGFNAGLVTSFEPHDYGTVDSTGSTLVIGAFGGVAKGALTLGGEFNRKSVSEDTDVAGTLLSVYGRYALRKKLNILVRLDLADPDTDAEGDGKTYVIAGLDLRPESGFNVTPNIRYISPETGSAQTVYHVNFQIKF